MRYNDKSVLENFHVATALSAMNDPNYNVFEYFTHGQNKLMRESLVHVVLSTDPMFHSEMLTQFNQQVDNGKRKRFESATRKARLFAERRRRKYNGSYHAHLRCEQLGQALADLLQVG